MRSRDAIVDVLIVAGLRRDKTWAGFFRDLEVCDLLLRVTWFGCVELHLRNNICTSKRKKTKILLQKYSQVIILALKWF